MALGQGQMAVGGSPGAWALACARALESWLERERGQAPLWAPIALGAGICAWFALPTPHLWLAWTLGWSALALLVWTLARAWRAGAFIAISAALLAAGCLLPWAKSMIMGASPLARPAMATFEADVNAVEQLVARDVIRLRLAPVGRADLPAVVRVTAPPGAIEQGIGRGARVSVRAYLMPPPSTALPGTYDYALRAWFDGIGATGRALGPVRLVRSGDAQAGLRQRLEEHVVSRLPGSAGAIAAALATGNQGGIPDADAEAMRRSGLAHLLSISGLHVSALIGGVIFIVLRLLALSPRLALHAPLLLISAVCGAMAGIGYTLLTGAQVPTVRSCIAALLVIAGLALGREAISLRLVAVGALIVMLFWPEAVIGPSFQMSFGAVVAIIALYEYPPVRRLFAPREERWIARLARQVMALLVTGFAVEIMLAPIAIYHFHRAGLLGAFANMVAIPLTSFVIMPAELLALILDLFGLGYPAWMVTGAALDLLLWVAHHVAALPYAVLPLPTTGPVVFALTMLGFLWLTLWRGGARWLGVPAILAGFTIMAVTPPADLLVTRDGRHVALRLPDGRIGLLRDRAGDYVRQSIAETLGVDSDLDALDTLPGARCSRDICMIDVPQKQGPIVRILATRSSAYLDWTALTRACATADIAISDRRLPSGCQPRWLRLDRWALARTGGVAIRLGDRTVITSLDPRDRHPWIIRPQQKRRSSALPPVQ
jgi:competence protein ComEC